MVVLSVHLATRSWAELGVVLLRLQTGPVGDPDRNGEQGWERDSGLDSGRNLGPDRAAEAGGVAGQARVGCEILPWQEAEAPTVVELAERLDAPVANTGRPC